MNVQGDFGVVELLTPAAGLGSEGKLLEFGRSIPGTFA